VLKTDFHIPDIALGCLALVICITLFLKPKILYGVYLPALSPVLKQVHKVDDAPLASALRENNNGDIQKQAVAEDVIRISSANAKNYKLLLEDFFKNNKPFLRAEYTLDQLVTDLKVPRYTLSAFINREYNMGFREFLNRHRVEYMIAHLNKPEWEQFTLEAIAEECGFSSRTSFIKNFKEITGQTPSAYIKVNTKNA
jgi:AraC-like DNA-binding protein